MLKFQNFGTPDFTPVYSTFHPNKQTDREMSEYVLLCNTFSLPYCRIENYNAFREVPRNEYFCEYFQFVGARSVFTWFVLPMAKQAVALTRFLMEFGLWNEWEYMTELV